MELSEVIAGIESVRVTGGTRVRVAAVACDSRKVVADTLFFAMPGAKTDGNEFVADATERGAVAIASPHVRPAELASAVTWIELTPGTERKALALAAANFYGHPADALQLAGVTGTNGKTTITFILDSILHAAGWKTGRIGTTGYQTPRGSRTAKKPDEVAPSHAWPPTGEAQKCEASLAQLVGAGCDSDHAERAPGRVGKADRPQA